ncbi:MAG: ABC transporter permease, partial [Syntrophothermus sp.]
EDDQVFADLDVAQKLTGQPEAISMIQVSALTDRVPLQKTVDRLAGMIPDGQVKVLNQVAAAEGRLLGKLTWLMALVAVLVLLAAALSVASTMTATVLERTREIGVMKALGAENRKVAGQFFLEAGLIGLAGGLIGLPLGFAAAQAIGRTVFGAAVGLNPAVIPVSLLVAVGVALLAGRGPVSRAVAVDPAVTLRGE